MKKSQGEIFGIALLFVIIITGVILYGKIKATEPDREEDLQTEGSYKIIAEGTLNTVLKMSTGCYVERGRDTVGDLVNFCLEETFANNDPQFTCDDGTVIQVCEHVIETLEGTMGEIFSTSFIGEIPYELKINVPANENSFLYDKNITNLGTFTFGDEVVDKSNLRDIGFQRAPSGLKTWATAQRNIEFNLYLYYR